MTLAEYIKLRNINDREAAEELGDVERSTVTKLRLGLRAPSWELAGKIEKWSQGAVPLKTWVNGK